MQFKFQDKGDIFIRLSSKCSSNCKLCSFSTTSNNIKSDIRNINIILSFIKNNIDGKYRIFFLGYNLLDLYDIKFFINLDFNIGIQLSYDDIKKNFNKLKILSKYKHIFTEVVFTINEKKDLILFFNLLTKQYSFPLSLLILIDFKKYKSFLDKFFKNYSSDFIEYNIGNLKVELENFSNNKIINGECFGLKNFYIKNNKIFIKTDLNIDLNGNISFHLNQYCNNKIKKISSIYSKNLLKDFEKIYHYLKLNANKQNRCNLCSYLI